jgi:hypothetical protein
MCSLSLYSMGEVMHLSTEEDVRAPPLGRTRELSWRSPKQQRWALLFLFCSHPIQVTKEQFSTTLWINLHPKFIIPLHLYVWRQIDSHHSLVVIPMTTAKRSYQVTGCPHWSNISSVSPLGVRAESSKNSYSLIFLFVGILKSNITVLIREIQNT